MSNHNPNAPHMVKQRSMVRTAPGAPCLSKHRKPRPGDPRAKDSGASHARINRVDPPEQHSRTKLDPHFPDFPKFKAPTRPEHEFETDPEFPASKTRLKAHSLPPSTLAIQIMNFRAAGFLPIAVSRLVNLHPKDIKTICP